MEGITIFPNLIQKIVLKEEPELNEKVIGYKNTARKLDVMTLIKYFVTASACEWKGFRHCTDVGNSASLQKVDYYTLSKKASHLDYNGIFNARRVTRLHFEQ
jgi:hypothetical protein